MLLDMPDSALRFVLDFSCTEAAFLAMFALVITGTAAQSTSKRTAGLAILCITTKWMENIVVPACLSNGRQHWAATAASLLWVQLLSASDLILVRRVHTSQLPNLHKLSWGPLRGFKTAMSLLWNIRRVGTSIRLQAQSRIGFILSRVFVTLLAYPFVDAVVSMPPPEQHMVRPEKAGLFSFRNLDADDVGFRSGTVVGYWLTTGILNLLMNNLGAVVAVLLGLSNPAECPPLYGPFSEAYTICRFWGVSWHQMFRSFLTGHADLIVDNFLPFSSRHSAISRHTRLMTAFFISGLIHYRADQLMGVPTSENRAVVFFLLHAAFIMLEDALGPLFVAMLPDQVRHVLGYFWVLVFFAWSSPVWIFSGMRLGISSAASLPVRAIGPWIEQSLGTA